MGVSAVLCVAERLPRCRSLGGTTRKDWGVFGFKMQTSSGRQRWRHVLPVELCLIQSSGHARRWLSSHGQNAHGGPAIASWFVVPIVRAHLLRLY
uniref:Secreted protein n=1 Tax=Globodera pallida TaxID=36090 RepID=A0A183C5X6_GLOPA